MISRMRMFRCRWIPALVVSQPSSPLLFLLCCQHYWPVPHAESRMAAALPGNHIIQKSLEKGGKISYCGSFFRCEDTFLKRSAADLFSHFVDWVLLGHMPIFELVTDKGVLPMNHLWAHDILVGHICDCGCGE